MSRSQYNAIRIAKQLCYKEDVIKRLKEAKSETEITRILRSAREEKK